MRLTIRLPALALLAGSMLAGPAAGCEPPGASAGALKLSGTHFNASIRPDPAPLRAHRFFRLDVSACALDGGALPTRAEVDARMPTHGHGMNYRASVHDAGAGRFVAEGLLLHMRGDWVIDVLLQSSDARERLRLPVSLE